MNDNNWLLNKIFYDAVLIDLDFSNWNRKVAICVVACSASMVRKTPVMRDRKQRTFLLEFHRVTCFQCNFNHYETAKKIKLSFVWCIQHFKLTGRGQNQIVEFYKGEDSLKWTPKFGPGVKIDFRESARLE